MHGEDDVEGDVNVTAPLAIGVVGARVQNHAAGVRSTAQEGFLYPRYAEALATMLKGRLKVATHNVALLIVLGAGTRGVRAVVVGSQARRVH